MGDSVGRPRHEEYKNLGFSSVSVKVGDKMTNQAKCLQCDKLVGNTAVKRLQQHKNRCKISLKTLRASLQQQNIDINSTDGENDSNSTGSEINLKRKAERSLASSLSSFDSDSDYISA